jgi:hypothetical protein
MNAPFKFFRQATQVQVIRDETSCLNIDLNSLAISVNPCSGQDLQGYRASAKEKVESCFGVFGYLEMQAGHYLILIEQAKLIGNILNAPVFQVTGLKYVPLYNRAPSANDKIYLEMVDKIARERAFYFSYHCDMTTSVQMQLKFI